MGAIFGEDGAHAGDGLPARLAVLDRLQLALQIGGEVGIVVLPVALDRALQVDAAGRQPPGALPGGQRIAFADLGLDDRAGAVGRQRRGERLDRRRFAMRQEQAAGDRAAIQAISSLRSACAE